MCKENKKCKKKKIKKKLFQRKYYLMSVLLFKRVFKGDPQDTFQSYDSLVLMAVWRSDQRQPPHIRYIYFILSRFYAAIRQNRSRFNRSLL